MRNPVSRSRLQRYAEQQEGLVPLFVQQQLVDVGATTSTVTRESSPQFGPLQCLHQFSATGVEEQTTYIDGAGDVVSWHELASGSSHPFARMLRVRSPTGSDFRTLQTGTVAYGFGY